MPAYNEYKGHLEARYWPYWNSRFGSRYELLQPGRQIGRGPPVFDESHRDLNVIVNPRDADSAERVRSELPRSARHRLFGSFNSSQALAQSVFGNLKVANKLSLLARLRDEDGFPVFFDEIPDPSQMTMEFAVDYLGETERRTTEVDVFFTGAHRLCVECKFTEEKVGSCSRPRLSPGKPQFEQQYCDGSYTLQRGRTQRCSLTEIGARYWDHLPGLLGWARDIDHLSCPLRSPYQLVRNILAAAVTEAGGLDFSLGHVVLLYDDRNPSFRPSGAGFEAWAGLRAELSVPEVLRRCSWQELADVLRADTELSWLTSELEAKYGL